MPRIRQNREEYARKDFRKAIDHAMTDADYRSIKALAEDLGIPYTSFWRMMQEPEKMTLGDLRKLCQVLPLPGTALLQFLGKEKERGESA